jgi:DNA-directed RNA polymerase specialized sigma24 family protein
MASTLQSAINSLAAYIPLLESRQAQYSKIYEENSDRIYSLSFWMTDNELTAEKLSSCTFLRAFSRSHEPVREQIDRAFITELRELVPVGELTLNCDAQPCESIRGNIKRIHLERAVVQLPATEKLIFLMHDVENYKHDRIARLLGITEEDSRMGLHQARMQIRQLIASM